MAGRCDRRHVRELTGRSNSPRMTAALGRDAPAAGSVLQITAPCSVVRALQFKRCTGPAALSPKIAELLNLHFDTVGHVRERVDSLRPFGSLRPSSNRSRIANRMTSHPCSDAKVSGRREQEDLPPVASHCAIACTAQEGLGRFYCGKLAAV